MVTACAAAATMPPAVAPAESLAVSSASLARVATQSGTPSFASCSRRASRPLAMLCASSTRLGRKSSASRSSTPPTKRMAVAQTMPAAADRERPRARRRRTMGANTAEMTTATAIEAVTVHSSVATNQATTRSPATARIRQPSSAKLTSQAGTSSPAGRSRTLGGPAAPSASPGSPSAAGTLSPASASAIRAS